MKAAYLMVCLALAQGISGRIFRGVQQQEYPRIVNTIVQPLESLDQYQKQMYQWTPKNSQSAESYYSNENRHQHDRHRKHSSNQDSTSSEGYYSNEGKIHLKPQALNSESYFQQRDNLRKPQDYSDNKTSQKLHQTKNSQEWNNQKYSQEVNNKKNSQEWNQGNSQEVISQKNSQEWNQRNSQEWNQKNSQEWNKKNSQEWNPQRNSGENLMRSTDGYAQPMNPTTSAKRNLALYSNLNVMQPAFGDAITWKGLRIAVGSNSPVKTNKDIEKIFSSAYKTMKTVSEEDIKKFHEEYQVAAKNFVNENAKEMLTNNQYPVEEYNIKTDDGYLLTLYRIGQKQSTPVTQNRPVVFLMHDFLGSADDFLVMGPKNSLAYLLADAGYDVYLGNARGNKYSRRHVSKHPAQEDFWQFSIDEIALHDLPALINFALKNSNQEKLYYVGHGLGNTALFALASARPEYNDKIVMMYALSPMVYMNNVRSPLFRMIAPNSDFSMLLNGQIGKGEFRPNVELIRTVGGDMCENEIGCKNVCSNIYPVMSGLNMENLDAEMAVKITKHLPAGASTRILKQFGQNVASGEFRKFDFGYNTNIMVYGSSQPTKYDMKKVTAPVALFFSEQDWLASPEDVARLESELPTVKDSYKVPENFSHMDFQFSRRAPEIIYTHIIESMQKTPLV